MSTAAEITACAREYIARRERLSHPDGSFDKGSRWYPSATESQPCCSAIRGPSRAWPYAYMTHCRTLAHVASVHGCDDLTLVRRAVKLLEQQHPSGSGWTPAELEQTTATLAVLVARKRLTGQDATPAQARKAATVAAAVLAASSPS